MAVLQKLDILIDVVENIGYQIKQQYERLRKREGRSRLSDVQKLPSLKILKEDT